MPVITTGELDAWSNDVESTINRQGRDIETLKAQLEVMVKRITDLAALYVWLMEAHPELIEAYTTAKAVEERMK
jgi:hypothetical protein